MSECSKLINKYNFKSKKDVQKWFLKNHPDKNDGETHPDFSIISHCYRNNLFKFKNNTPQKSPHKKLNKKITKKKRDKLFSCMRKTANFSNIDNNFKFDKNSFNPENLNNSLQFRSPKMSQLLNNIKTLDELDQKNHGKKFKHFIFSDVKEGGYGAKIIASVFTANGFNNVIKARKIPKQAKLKLYIDSQDNDNNFGLLSSNSVFGTNFNEKIKKELLKLFNQRPDNINGKKLRFIIFDSGFKEGIDLFDVKYVHIFEPSMTIADLKQTIGRATRTCGQKGLDFIPNIGWPLYVYNYYLTVPTLTQNSFSISKSLTFNDNSDNDEDILVFKNIEKFNDATMLYSEFDRAMNNLSTQLYTIGPVLAVDHFLTNNLHNIEDLNHEIMEKDYYLMGGANGKPKTNTKKEITDVYGKKMTAKRPLVRPRFDSFSRVPKKNQIIKIKTPVSSMSSDKKILSPQNNNSNVVLNKTLSDQKIKQQPIASPQKPITSSQQRIASPQQPIASPQQPIASPQQPIASPQQSIASREKSINSINKLSSKSVVSINDKLPKTPPRPRPQQRPTKKNITKQYDNKLFKKSTNKQSKFFLINNIDCRGKCGKRSTKDVPVTTDFLKKVYLKYNHPKKFLPKTELREWLCKYMRDEDNGYCKQLNNEWNLRYAYVPQIFEKNKSIEKIKDDLEDLNINIESESNENDTGNSITSSSDSVKSITPTNSHILEDIKYPLLEYTGNKTQNKTENNEKKSNTNKRIPNTRLNFIKMRDFIKSNYNTKNYKWDKIVIENKCIPKKNEQQNNKPDIELNPTQNFITDYFCPQSPYKGLLLWHSVGTGKTCSGVSIASSSFEREGYTILWVTRTTLKGDVWKNIFDQICHSIIADEVKKGLIIPEDISRRKRLLSDRWLEPMSYKQFSNLLAGKNSIYDILRQRNGTEDVLKKTLIIIDEAHKLYGGDLKAAERPDTNIMENLIMNSYKKSGNDSCKLLIMTATPFTNTPLELFSLINLFYTNEDEKITTDKEDFKSQYMTSDGILSQNGIKTLANKLSGYISYLNREKDATQFAQPVMINVPILMTHINNNDFRNVIYLKEKLDDIKSNNLKLINEIKEKIKQFKNDIKNNKLTIKTITADIKKRCKQETTNKTDYNRCIQQIEIETEIYDERIQQALDEIDLLNRNLDRIKENEVNQKLLKNRLKNEAKTLENLLIQEYVLFKKCQNFKYKKLENEINKAKQRQNTKSLSFKKTSSNKVTRKYKSL